MSEPSPLRDASLFALQARARTTFPPWYFHRQVQIRLRRSARDFLDLCGIGPGQRVLELGCGSRPYEPMVAALGARYEGADLPGNPHADVRVGPDGRVAAADGSYDAVLSIQVLEHVPDPAAYLAEARRLLRPGGRLILSTHGIWVYHPSPEDLWRWTSAGLRRTVERAGFRIVAFRGLIGTLPAGLSLVQDAIRPKLRWRLLKHLFSMIMQALIGLADRLHCDGSRARDAMVYMLVAEPVDAGRSSGA